MTQTDQRRPAGNGTAQQLVEQTYGQRTAEVGPYASAAWLYVKSGWPGTLPIGRQPARKSPPPTGYTGWAGRDPSGADVQTWIDGREGCFNIGLHIPEGVYVPDFDVEGRKEELERLAGVVFPPTWTSTSRGGGSARRHAFYRATLPEGRMWMDHPRPGMDSLHIGHRYAVVWPSTHPDTGQLYHWYDPDGELYEGVPTPDELAELPAELAAVMSKEGTPIDGTAASDDETLATVRAFRPGEPCPRVRRHLDRELVRIAAARKAGSIREPASLYALTAYGIEGHAGVGAALTKHQAAYVAAREQARGEHADTASGDWWRQVRGAVGKKLSDTGGAIMQSCGCDLPRPDQPAATDGTDAAVGRSLVAVRASEITMRAVRWLWEEAVEQTAMQQFLNPARDAKWLPLGGLCLLGGREGIGKTTWAYRIAAQLTTGTLPGSFRGQPRSVVIAATEDDWARTIVPRLTAAGADLTRVLRVDAVEDGYVSGLTLPADIAALKDLCEREEVALVLLDPLMGTISGALDTHKDGEVRRALEPLSRLAHTAQLTVLGLIHVNKSQGSDLLTRLMASRAFSAVARAVLFAAKEEPEPGAEDTRETFLFGQAKNNLAARVWHSVKYHIEGVKVGRDDELGVDIWSSHIVVDGTTDGRIDDLMTAQENRTVERETVSDRAEKWLRTFLTGRGAVPSEQVKEAARDAGFTVSTLKRVLADAGVRVAPIRGTHKTAWSLDPPPSTEPVEPVEPTELIEPVEPVGQKGMKAQLAQLAHGSKPPREVSQLFEPVVEPTPLDEEEWSA